MRRCRARNHLLFASIYNQLKQKLNLFLQLRSSLMPINIKGNSGYFFVFCRQIQLEFFFFFLAIYWCLSCIFLASILSRQFWDQFYFSGEVGLLWTIHAIPLYYTNPIKFNRKDYLEVPFPLRASTSKSLILGTQESI